MQKFNYPLPCGGVYSLPYPTILDLQYLYTDNESSLLQTTFDNCTEAQQKLFEDDFLLLADLINSIKTYHYTVLSEVVRYESFFEKSFNDRREKAMLIEDAETRRKTLEQISKSENKHMPPTGKMVEVVQKHASQSDKANDFNSWVFSVSQHLKMSINEVGNMPYSNFIKASDQMLYASDIRIAQSIEEEQAAKQREVLANASKR